MKKVRSNFSVFVLCKCYKCKVAGGRGGVGWVIVTQQGRGGCGEELHLSSRLLSRPGDGVLHEY